MTVQAKTSSSETRDGVVTPTGDDSLNRNLMPWMVFNIKGMSCGACVERIQKALTTIKGVAQARVDLDLSQGWVQMDPRIVNISDLQESIENLGYQFWGGRLQQDSEGPGPARGEDQSPSCCTVTGEPGLSRARWPYLVGLAAAAAVIGFYLGMNTLTSDWFFAKAQFEDFGGWIISLAVGLGIQVTLFSLFKATLHDRARAGGGTLAATSGMSGIAMAACCSHYLAAFLPTVGLPFLSGFAASLEQYQTELFMAGILGNFFGVWLMLRLMARHGIFRPDSIFTRLTFSQNHLA